MIFDIIVEYDRLIVYDKHTDEILRVVWDVLIKADFLMIETYKDRYDDEFWLFKKDETRAAVQKSYNLNALFLYLDKLSDEEIFHTLLEQCPCCGSSYIDSWMLGAYDRMGLPSPDRHCSVCKMQWHDSKTFKALMERMLSHN